ncbi:hypothetical protein GIB67_001604 [Kingdonia uniflora]|uniref:ORM1-like protein 3 n=1 Tax=Kingdonia uniflora TaxID=39325 RepID=A0A7J7L0P6_9MAGN|nr:hypothetical protein GIB67_001604 [Kingdonia uniflora]
MGKLYGDKVAAPDVNKNTEWFTYPGVWTTYIMIVFFAWIMVLSVFGCNPGMAWTIVNLGHFAVTYHFFHWKKGTPFAEDQGIYNGLTWWEQMDNGKQLTRNRKFLTVVPVVLRLNRGKVSFGQNLPKCSKSDMAIAAGPNLSDFSPVVDCYDMATQEYLIASHVTDYQHPMLFLNTLAVFVLVIAKFPNMHKVRIFGINADQ